MPTSGGTESTDAHLSRGPRVDRGRPIAPVEVVNRPMQKDREAELGRLHRQTRDQLLQLRDESPVSYEMRYGYLLAMLTHVLDVLEEVGDTEVRAAAQARRARRRRFRPYNIFNPFVGNDR